MLHWNLLQHALFLTVLVPVIAGMSTPDILLVDEDYADTKRQQVYMDTNNHAIRHFRKNRPMPGDTLPDKPLHVEVDLTNHPLPHDTRRTMRLLMGDRFNKKFTSIKEPRENQLYPNGVAEFPPKIRLNNKWKKLHFKVPNVKNPVRIRNKRARRLLRKFLAQYTSCPVDYRWIRLDEYHWPRWLKTGKCNATRACSVPSGDMGCYADETTNVTLMYWDCRINRPCKWIYYDFPVITACKCACPKTQDKS